MNRRIIYIKNPTSGSNFRTLTNGGGSGRITTPKFVFTAPIPTPTPPTYRRSYPIGTTDYRKVSTYDTYTPPTPEYIPGTAPQHNHQNPPNTITAGKRKWQINLMDPVPGMASVEDWKKTKFTDIFDFGVGRGVKFTTFLNLINPVQIHKDVMATDGGYWSLLRIPSGARLSGSETDTNDYGTYGYKLRNGLLIKPKK